MATLTTSERAVPVKVEVLTDEQAHAAITERNANHEAAFDDFVDNIGNLDTRAVAHRTVVDGNVLSTDAHRPDRAWLQHEDFTGGSEVAQAVKDAKDHADRVADRDKLVADRELEAKAVADIRKTVTTETFHGKTAAVVAAEKAAADKAAADKASASKF